MTKDYHSLSTLLLLSVVSAAVFANEHQYNIDAGSEHGRAHLKEDLHGGPVSKPIDEMNTEELQFHYFRQHDFDHNDKLDGSELVVSLSHHQRQQDGTVRAFTDDQLADIIDEILKRHDTNHDGMMSFEEYVAPFKDMNTQTKVEA